GYIRNELHLKASSSREEYKAKNCNERGKMKEINRVFYVCLFFLGIILNVSWLAHVRAAAPRPLRVAYMSTSATMASLWMVEENGGIAEEGGDVEGVSPVGVRS